jgi:hypothetical protein
MKKQNLKTLAGTIRDYVVAKHHTSQVVGGITDPNEDQDAPRTKSETRQNSTS